MLEESTVCFHTENHGQLNENKISIQVAEILSAYLDQFLAYKMAIVNSVPRDTGVCMPVSSQ